MEIIFWKVVGDLLDKSAWATMLTDSGVATAGRTDSCIHSGHLKCTEAYEQLKKEDEYRSTWKIRMVERSSTFSFWQLMQYVQRLREMVRWCFALDHPNYSRWLAVHIRDMESLPKNLKEELKQGWTFMNTSRQFSIMLLDQAHEQHNAIVKGSGGAVGLTANSILIRIFLLTEGVLIQNVRKGSGGR